MDVMARIADTKSVKVVSVGSTTRMGTTRAIAITAMASSTASMASIKGEQIAKVA